jgi:uncharacterized membrane protein YgaE (UPF0421/DUF939 family)
MNNIYNNKKPCDCSYCSQFYFARLQKNNYQKIKNTQVNTHVNSHIDTNTNTDKNENYTKEANNNIKKDNYLENKNLTLNDFDKITYLKKLDCNIEEISKQTNLSYSIVEYVINIIMWK